MCKTKEIMTRAQEIKILATQLAEQEEKAYKEWCGANPGYILHNSGIRALQYSNIVKDCNSLDDVITMKRDSLDKWEKSNGPNGHLIASQCCDVVIKKILEQSKG